MKCIAFHIEKGGTGKTTICGNVGFALKDHGRTLLIDGDPQANLSSWYLTEGFEYELADVLQNRVSIEKAVLEIRKGLYLLPSFAIGGSLKSWSETSLINKPYAFLELTEKLGKLGFDYALFDLGPGISVLERSVLAVMDEIVPVVAAEYFSADGIEIFEHVLEELRRDRRATFSADKMIVNRLNRRYALHRVYHELIAKKRYKLFPVGQSTAISDCVTEHVSVFEYEPKNRYLSTFRDVARAWRNGRGS